MMYLGFDLDDEGAAAENGAADSGGGSIESWLTRFQEGKGRPTWMEPTIAPLVKMLKAVAVEEQLAAAVPLVALGRKSDALPTLIDAGRRRPDSIGEASRVLPWLHRGDRLDVFKKLMAANPGPDQFAKMAGQLAVVRDTRAIGPLWDLTTPRRAGPPGRLRDQRRTPPGLFRVACGHPAEDPQGRASAGLGGRASQGRIRP